jgi:hypothetical protein
MKKTLTLSKREIEAILDVIDDWEAAKRCCSEEWGKGRAVIHSACDKLLGMLRKEQALKAELAAETLGEGST